MATVDVFTAARSQAIEDSSIVDGTIDGSGHLILTTHGGTDIDAGYALVAVPDASTTVKGVSELATQTETEAHTDATRSVTPSSLASTIARIGVLEALPGDKVQTIAAPAESASYASYPSGVSITNIGTGSGWTINAGFGTIVTVQMGSNRTIQTLYSTTGGTQVANSWYRTYHSSNGGGGWTGWSAVANPRDPATMGFTGEIKAWPTDTIPTGWLLADGSLISRTTYAALFATLGTVYGAGDGTTTFGIPDLKGRTVVGRDGSVTEFNAVGKTGGEMTHVLITAEMPSHTHTQNAHGHSLPGNGALTDGSGTTNYNSAASPVSSVFRTNQVASTTAVNNNTGGDGAHNNLQPYMALRYIIKT